MKTKIYECGICGCYHPWEWDGDCRDDANRIASPEEYAKQLGVDPWAIEVMSMDDRIEADCDDEIARGLPMTRKSNTLKTARVTARIVVPTTSKATVSICAATPFLSELPALIATVSGMTFTPLLASTKWKKMLVLNISTVGPKKGLCMSKLKVEYQEGDLFEALPISGGVVIPHVVNSVGAWGAGFVIPLGRKFPRAMETYRQWHKNKEWADLSVDPKVPFKLGNTIIPQVQWDNDDNIIFVANMLAQDGLPSGSNRQPLQYDALEKCIVEVGEFAKNRKLSVYCPLFGAGIAGGDWYKIELLVRKHWIKQGVPVTCFYLRDKLPPGWNPPQPRKGAK